MKKNPFYYVSIHLLAFIEIIIFTVLREIYQINVLILLYYFSTVITLCIITLFIYKKNKIYFLWALLLLIFIFFNALTINSREKFFLETIKNFSEYEEYIGVIKSFPVLKNSKEEIRVKIFAAKKENTTDFIYIKPFHILSKIKNSDDEKSFEKGDVIKIIKPVSPAQEKIFNFNYRKYLYYNNIFGVVRAEEDEVEIVEKIKPDIVSIFFKKTVWAGREKIINFLKERLSSRAFGFLISIYLGERSELDKEIFQDFTNTGLLHLIAISGLNISFLSLIFFSIFKNIFSKSISLLFSLFFLFIYIILIIPSASSTRAFLMFLLPIMYFLSGRKTSGFTVLSITGLLMCLQNPYCIFDIGFQFSFYATAGIMLFSNLIKRKLPVRIPDGIKTDISITLSAFISILFIQWPVFKQVSFFSVISSIFMIPFFNIFFGVSFFLLLLFCITKLGILLFLIENFTSLFLETVHLLDFIPAQKLQEIPVIFGYLFLPALFILFYFFKKVYFILYKNQRMYKFVKSKI